MAQLLRLPIKSAHVSLVGVGAEPVTTAKQKVVAIVKSRCSDYTATIECMVLPKPTAELPVVTVPGLWKIPEGIALADPTFFHSRRVDMILGAELFAELLQTGKIQLGENQPTLINSVFGWIVSGKVDPSPPVQANNAVVLTSIETLMERFFAIEDADTNNNLTIEETACENFYRETTTRHDDGKFVVRLPQKSDMINSLGESKSMATKRLLAIEKRLDKEPGTREAYTTFMKEYEELGHMSVVSKEGDGHSTAYYMPHHPVFKADSSTTKCRVVFDASAKSSSGISLNDTLMVAPTLQQEATTILIRFRTKPIALTADIAKMYRQIWVHPSDRHLQRILWRPSRDMPTQEYELNTVTYGTAAAPYLAIKSLQQTAVDHGAQFPQAAAKMSDFYVDDFISGETTVEAAKTLKREVIDMVAKAGFCLRKWASNNPNVLQGISEESLASPLLQDESEAALSTLGMIWEPNADTFRVKINISETGNTKRSILSQIARIFDPLGLLDPVKALAKQLMQKSDNHPTSYDRL
ncbi:uncharacterized protein LOC131264776 [Anopheles coustani]|uniref:uncharacterized protein LOC131264776 n=1 Tax=Anopheles coustani TaxID=139045 RepID=UPI002657BB42|nr:uncharacterized protein LOC131264776 [Anopheles coustani]